jgi:hypothetical protein
MSPTCPTHPIRSDYSDSVWRGVKVTRLFIMHFSPTSGYCIPLWSKCTSRHPVLTHSHSKIFSYWGRSVLIAIKIYRQTYKFLHTILMFAPVDSRGKDETS